MHVYINVYVCIYVYMNVYCVYEYMCPCVSGCVNVYMRECMYVSVCVMGGL